LVQDVAPPFTVAAALNVTTTELVPVAGFTSFQMDTLSLAPVTSVIFVIATALYVTESWVAMMSPVETPTISNRFDPAATVWLQVSGVADPPRLLAASKMGRASTVNNGLVLAVLVPSVMSVAVTVIGPGVFSVTLKVLVPPARAAFAGKVALPSLEVIPTVCVELTTYQSVSTAFTVTVNAVPVPCAVGVPVFPLPGPGAAVSPGTRSCSFTNGPVTLIEGLVFAVLPVFVISLAVRV